MKRLMLILPLVAAAGCASKVALREGSNATQAVDGRAGGVLLKRRQTVRHRSFS